MSRLLLSLSLLASLLVVLPASPASAASYPPAISYVDRYNGPTAHGIFQAKPGRPAPSTLRSPTRTTRPGRRSARNLRSPRRTTTTRPTRSMQLTRSAFAPQDAVWTPVLTTCTVPNIKGKTIAKAKTALHVRLG